MFSAFLVFPAWNVSVWPGDNLLCISVPLSPGFLLWGELAVSQGLAFGRVFLRLSVVGHFPFQTCH